MGYRKIGITLIIIGVIIFSLKNMFAPFGTYGFVPLTISGIGFPLYIASIACIIVGIYYLKKKEKLRFQEPMDVLKTRYAKGEITKEEFEEKKKDLENS